MLRAFKVRKFSVNSILQKAFFDFLTSFPKIINQLTEVKACHLEKKKRSMKNKLHWDRPTIVIFYVGCIFNLFSRSKSFLIL